eukprot:TRINITY_DN55761_c0_g1_i1.p1 TRINITY_DN55761_c0_g1~~TRINITY_DN55761_c0_g1_i1.p1  ORF type:complete len:837 (+),score=323.46 TRINITY_DN55761_c0_g1_i1:104-2512(+)
MSHAAAAALVHHESQQVRTGAFQWDQACAEGGGSSDESDPGGRQRRRGVKFDPSAHLPEREENINEIQDAMSVASDMAERERVKLRRRINQLFDEPDSSPQAMWVSVFFMLLIFLSTLAFMLETLPYLSPDPEYGDPARAPFWFWLETTFVSFFTLEYLVRWISCDNICAFPIMPFNIIDLLAILPFYVELMLRSSGGDADSGVQLRFVRVIRLARVFRVLKMGKKFDGAQMLVNVFKDSWKTLIPPFFFLTLGMIFFSSIMWICEQGTYDSRDGRFYVDDVQGHRVESVFISIPEGLWWAIVTMTTVGYGDYTPNTALGRACNSAAMMFGVMFSAMPIAVIGNTFTKAWQEERVKMNATKEFRKNDQINNTTNWGPSQLKFFGLAFAERACRDEREFFVHGTQPQLPNTQREDFDNSEDLWTQFADGNEDGIDDNPENYVDRSLSHDLITNRVAIETQLPEEQRNLAYKLYHIIRAESSKCEHNIEMYTLDFVTELYYVLGFADLDERGSVHFGFRSKAGLTVQFGQGKHLKEIKSDSDLGIYTLVRKKRERERIGIYWVANQCKTTTTPENLGRIAGELLATTQQAYRKSELQTPRRVFLVTFRGYHLSFYTAFFTTEYLDCIARGKRPTCEVVVDHFPPKRNMEFPGATIMGTFDFLTPSHRAEAIRILLRIKRILLHYAVAEGKAATVSSSRQHRAASVVSTGSHSLRKLHGNDANQRSSGTTSGPLTAHLAVQDFQQRERQRQLANPEDEDTAGSPPMAVLSPSPMVPQRQGGGGGAFDPKRLKNADGKVIRGKPNR